MTRLILEVIDNANTIFCLSSLNVHSFSFKSLKSDVGLRFLVRQLANHPKVDNELSSVKRYPVGEPPATKESIGSGGMRVKCMQRRAHWKYSAVLVLDDC